MAWTNNRTIGGYSGQQNSSDSKFNRMNNNNLIMNIRELNSDVDNVKIRGLVITKSPLRIVRVNYDNTSMQNVTGFKGVFNFTVRDSATDFINITSWGRSEYSKTIYNHFHIGDVVCVSNASIEKKKTTGHEYSVQTSCEFSLVISEKQSSVELYYDGDRNYIVALQNTLLHSMSDHVTLLNVILFMESSSKEIMGAGQHFTFLAMVSKVGQIQDLLSKTQKDENNQAKMLHKLDVILMDETCKAFPLTIWDQEWINFVKINWIPRVTVISLVDCKVKYDEYKRGFVGIVDGRTISIQNPDVIESHKLHNLMNIENAMAYELGSGNLNMNIDDSFNPRKVMGDEDIPLSSIQSVVTVKTIKSRSMDTEYGIIYGVLSTLNLDSDDPLLNLVSLRCKNCKRRIMPRQLYCTTVDCPMLAQNVTWTNKEAVEVEFHTTITICDHTGTLTKCSLSGQAMESLLRCTPYQLMDLDQHMRAQLKWDLFLNRYKFYIKSSLPSFDNSSPFMKILGIQIPTVYEILASVKE